MPEPTQKRCAEKNSNQKSDTPMPLFSEFQPFFWCPAHPPAENLKSIYSIKRNHGVNGTYKLHNLNDAINDDRDLYKKILIEYSIKNCSYPIYTVADLINASYSFDEPAYGNIRGDIAERIARRITKYFLKHWSKKGKTGGIFSEGFDPAHREDFIIANTADYVLKIQKYPNLIILRRTGKGKFGYENIKELDGFFDYRYQGTRHILVLESKLETINVQCDQLIKNLFVPLRELFPDAIFSYILFTDKNSIFIKSAYPRFRKIKQTPITIYQNLKKAGINSLFFSFNESHEDFEMMKNFLITQYRALHNLEVTINGKTVLTDREITIFDGGETPHIKLVKDLESGLWKEIPLRHKRNLSSK